MGGHSREGSGHLVERGNFLLKKEARPARQAIGRQSAAAVCEQTGAQEVARWAE